ncbi:hypothetical protein [Phenylobacterium sp.]|uniref:hypothetical protein n=1 Tax=Phenylobacterium sp. TaxID=1871053 RepID=UPI002B9DAA4A|nr:hypothetical protein [Phenylobacterium sp.]HLZ75557.1 hypothetical protein [Phenylobacterium sp.]
MPSFDPSRDVFRAAPIVDKQVFVAAEKPDIPPSYRLVDAEGFWIAADRNLPVVPVLAAGGRRIGFLLGNAYSEFHGEFLPEGEAEFPVAIATIGDLELLFLPRISGSFVFVSCGGLPKRIYMDHGASFPIVYSPSDRRAASSVALLLTEADYQARFRADLHNTLIGKEGTGSWISGTLTAHRGVHRVIANHYLDLETWTARRFWPRPGEFAQWRDFDEAVDVAAKAVTEFSAAASRAFSLGVTLTAGMDSRLLVASCRPIVDKVEFFTLEAPNTDMDADVSSRIAKRFGLAHRVMPLHAASEEAMAVWDRMVGDCTMEVTRRTYTTVADLTERNAILTGLYGETARCRLYRQDYETINQGVIDVDFIADRLTVPQHPELLDNFREWLAELEGQPNSVIMEMAFVELKVGIWSMGQRPISNSVKLNFLPFCQRRVLEMFVGVEPAKKGTEALFMAVILRLWPELMEFKINKYGDARDRLTIFKKLANPNKVRRYLRDRFAKKMERAK